MNCYKLKKYLFELLVVTVNCAPQKNTSLNPYDHAANTTSSNIGRHHTSLPRWILFMGRGTSRL